MTRISLASATLSEHDDKIYKKKKKGSQFSGHVYFPRIDAKLQHHLELEWRQIMRTKSQYDPNTTEITMTV